MLLKVLESTRPHFFDPSRFLIDYQRNPIPFLLEVVSIRSAEKLELVFSAKLEVNIQEDYYLSIIENDKPTSFCITCDLNLTKELYKLLTPPSESFIP